ncbi:Polysaccharide biosynthesis protein [compost metagenome]
MIKKIINFGAWTILGAIFTRAANLAITVFIARLVSPDEFGAFSVTQNMGATLTAFATFGLATTCSKRIAEHHQIESERAESFTLFLSLSILLALCLCSIIAIYSESISEQIYNNKDIENSIIAAALLILFSSIASVAQGGLMGAHEFKKISRINIQTSAVTLTLPIFIYHSFGPTAGLFSIAAPHMASMVLSLKHCHSIGIISSPKEIGRSYAKEKSTLLGLTLPAALSTALVGPTNWIATTILVRHSDSLRHIAEYNVAYQIYAALIFIPSTLASITLPLIVSSNKKSIVKSFASSTTLTTTIAATTALAAYLLSDTIIRVYGGNYTESSEILRILCITVVLNSLNMNIAALIASNNKMWLGLISNLAWAATYVVSAHILIPSKMGKGLALAMLISYLVHTVLQGILAFLLTRKTS